MVSPGKEVNSILRTLSVGTDRNAGDAGSAGSGSAGGDPLGGDLPGEGPGQGGGGIINYTATYSGGLHSALAQVGTFHLM